MVVLLCCPPEGALISNQWAAPFVLLKLLRCTLLHISTSCVSFTLKVLFCHIAFIVRHLKECVDFKCSSLRRKVQVTVGWWRCYTLSRWLPWCSTADISELEPLVLNVGLTVPSALDIELVWTFWHQSNRADNCLSLKWLIDGVLFWCCTGTHRHCQASSFPTTVKPETSRSESQVVPAHTWNTSLNPTHTKTQTRATRDVFQQDQTKSNCENVLTYRCKWRHFLNEAMLCLPWKPYYILLLSCNFWVSVFTVSPQLNTKPQRCWRNCLFARVTVWLFNMSDMFSLMINTKTTITN